ncbi:EAL domain-containing protein [Terriglobus roseus]|uniref:PAS domain S-box-containing protein n=1 Tax=Terriglobus roseus TaxID=392734 RepID=A0A1H4MZY8_9BACT|nr:EAL domain-containing protein [Terriglobus roseus]SEB88760.1 PAS domain S-box-containing protein [Terriglobus roseus]
MLIELPDVRLALEKDQLVPFFQPVVELRTGRLRGFEVLARWHHPEHGLTLPSNFIALAEANGLIGELTHQIFRKAFLAAHLLPDDLTLAVNVSPIQMQDENLPAQILRDTEETRFPLSRLVVEITESALHRDLKQAQTVAADLKTMGCRLALDDFGTGYSSLRHLQSMHFDEIKIDQSFVREMTTDRNCRKIVAAIVGLGQSLGLETVAEGVETEEQADMLIWLGCELAQGWRYGKAEAAEAIPRTITAPPITPLPGLTTPGNDWASSSLEALPTLRLAQLQAVYDGAPVGLCFLDRNFRYVNLNRRLAEMNGIDLKSHLGRTVREMFPEWFLLSEPYLRRALQGEAISGVEVHIPNLMPGEINRELIASYQPAWDEADEVIGISVSLLDVTEHRRVDEARHRGATSQAPSFEVNPEVPWVMDSEGNDLQVSSRWVQTTPLGKDRTRNLHWLEALNTLDLEPTIRAMKHALQTGKPIDVEYRIEGVEGGWRWMRSRGTARFADNGEITRWYGSVEDINDRKLQEQAANEASSQSATEDHETLAKGILLGQTLQSLSEVVGEDESAAQEIA